MEREGRRELGGEGREAKEERREAREERREAKEEGRRESRQRRNSLVGFDNPSPPAFQGWEGTLSKDTMDVVHGDVD